MANEFYTTGTEYYTAPLKEAISPLELVKYAKSVLLFMADSSQPQREVVCLALQQAVDERCMSAIESGDADILAMYSKAGRFVSKYIKLYGNGSDFGRIAD